MREKKNYKVTLTQELYEKILTGAPKKTLLTVYSVIESYKVNGSIARRVLAQVRQKMNDDARACAAAAMLCAVKCVFTGVALLFFYIFHFSHTQLLADKKIKSVVQHSDFQAYTKAVADEE